MARTQPAFLRLLTEVEELVDDITANARADGEIDAAERHVIERARFIGRELERGNLARLRHQAIENSWSLDDSPRMQRNIRELIADIGTDDDPDDGGAPQMRAA